MLRRLAYVCVSHVCAKVEHRTICLMLVRLKIFFDLLTFAYCLFMFLEQGQVHAQAF